MRSSDLIRWGGFAAMGGGVLFIVYGLLGVALGIGEEESSPFLDILAILGYVLQVVGLLGFHARQGRHYGRIGRVGLYTTIGAILVFVFFILASLLESTRGVERLTLLPVVGTLVGAVLYGAATLQARVLPRWCGILFILLMPGAILFGNYVLTAIWSGLVWLALGYGLWSHRSGAAAEQPSRVR